LTVPRLRVNPWEVEGPEEEGGRCWKRSADGGCPTFVEEEEEEREEGWRCSR
jgi:hypothetical protein